MAKSQTRPYLLKDGRKHVVSETTEVDGEKVTNQVTKKGGDVVMLTEKQARAFGDKFDDPRRLQEKADDIRRQVEEAEKAAGSPGVAQDQSAKNASPAQRAKADDEPKPPQPVGDKDTQSPKRSDEDEKKANKK